jgi:hypothetical protein
MHAVHLSPHTVEIAKSTAVVASAGIAAVGIVALVLATTSWYLWLFT